MGCKIGHAGSSALAAGGATLPHFSYIFDPSFLRCLRTACMRACLHAMCACLACTVFAYAQCSTCECVRARARAR